MTVITINFYGAKWCNYCKEFTPYWNMLKDLIENTKECSNNELSVIMNHYDETKKEDVPIIQAHGIKSYPTIRYCITDAIITDQQKFCTDYSTLDSDKREPHSFIMTIFAKFPKVKDILLNKLKSQQSQNQSGGFFQYSKNPKYKYYKEYLKCRNKYLELKKLK